jgi:hypothetical protein
VKTDILVKKELGITTLENLEDAWPFCPWLDGTECVPSFAKAARMNKKLISPFGYQYTNGKESKLNVENKDDVHNYRAFKD